jgi:hypothetical protein
MAEESNLEALQRKVKTVQRRSALCYLVAQILGDDKLVKDPIARPITLLNLSLKRGDTVEWNARYKWDELSKVIAGRILVQHIDTDEHGRDLPASTKEREPRWQHDLNVAIYRGAIPHPEDLFAQEQMLDRALEVIQSELESIRKDLRAGETFPKIGPYR